MAEPNPADIIEALSDAIPQVRHVDPLEFHRAVRKMYNWHDVARRTERVYDRMIEAPKPTLLERLHKYNACGPVAGKLFCLVVLLDYLIYRLLEWLMPRDKIDRAPNFPYELFANTKDKL
jgi:phosphatidylinositol glycan class A protein